MKRIEAYANGTWVVLHGSGHLGDDLESALQVDAVNSIGTLTLGILPTCSVYDSITCNTRVRVKDEDNGKWEFFGRVIEPLPEMQSGGTICKEALCEDALGFLKDKKVWIDSRKSFYNASGGYAVEIDEDGGRTMYSADLLEVLIANYNSVVDAEWKKIRLGTIDLGDSETTFAAEYEKSYYDMIAGIASDAGAEYRYRYDGEHTYLDMAHHLGDEGGVLKIGDNLASSALKTSMASVITRMFPLGETYAKLEKKDRKGTTVTGALKGSNWDTSAKYKTGGAAKMVRFDVEGSLKCVLNVDRRNKDYAMVFFTDGKIAEKSTKLLKKYVPTVNTTANITKHYEVPDGAKYCYVFGDGSECTTYGYHTNSAGSRIKDSYRVGLGFWMGKLTSSELSSILAEYGCSIGSVTDEDGDKRYYISKNEDKYGAIDGTCEKSNLLNTSKITDRKKTVYALSDLNATKSKARRFIRYACQQLSDKADEAVELTATGYDLAEAGLDYRQVCKGDWWTVENDLCGIDHRAEVVNVRTDKLEPWNVQVELGSEVTRASSTGSSSSSLDSGITPSGSGDDDDSAADDIDTASSELADAAEEAASKAVEKAAELDPLSYQIQVDSLAAGQMASEAYDTVSPITDAMRGLLSEAEAKAHSMTAVVTRQEQTFALANELARATASFACETEDSVVKWRKAFTASLDAFASEDPEVQADIAAAYALLYGANGTADNPEADSAQGHLNAAKETNVTAAKTYSEMKAEWEAAKAYKASCDDTVTAKQAAYDTAKAAYDKLKVKNTSSKKQLDSAWTALLAAEGDLGRAQEAADSADAECGSAEGRYLDALAALQDAEAKVAAARAEVDTAINGIHEKYRSFFEVTANRIAAAVTKEDMDGAISEAGLEITAEMAKTYATKTDVDGKVSESAAQEIVANLIKQFVADAGGSTTYSITSSGVKWTITQNMTAVQDSTARSNASSAATAASNAQSTANSASSTASSAQSTANSALSTANSASSTATSAYNMAYDIINGTGTLSLGGNKTAISMGGTNSTITLCGGVGSIVAYGDYGQLQINAPSTSVTAFSIVTGNGSLIFGGGTLNLRANLNVNSEDITTTGGGNISSSGTVTGTKLITTSPRTGTSSTANCRISTSSSYEGEIVFTASSSKRYKHDIDDLCADGIRAEKLYDLPVRQFVWNSDYLLEGDRRDGVTVPGFIAEEVAERYHVAAEYDKYGEVENWNERFIIPGMLKLIQDQHKQLEAQQAQIDELKARVEALEAASL